MKRPFVCFGSFQDYRRNPSTGGIKTKNEWVHATNWDCVILDEYHYGAWRESARELFEAEDEKEIAFGEGEGIKIFDQDIMPITTDGYLYLSGTPFRAIASGEFIEEQIYNWTYSTSRGKASGDSIATPTPRYPAWCADCSRMRSAKSPCRASSTIRPNVFSAEGGQSGAFQIRGRGSEVAGLIAVPSCRPALTT